MLVARRFNNHYALLSDGDVQIAISGTGACEVMQEVADAMTSRSRRLPPEDGHRPTGDFVPKPPTTGTGVKPAAASRRPMSVDGDATALTVLKLVRQAYLFEKGARGNLVGKEGDLAAERALRGAQDGLAVAWAYCDLFIEQAEARADG